ncbi:MAG: molybdopterin-binding protein [Peptococcaceae bacterium]|nr:molybdopterin-binding protein [Peptococcaceae bacterium]
MIEKAVILPTGQEICDGVVIDTDSPEVMQQLLRLNPMCQVERRAPVPDAENLIAEAIDQASEADLVILIGGSGGGRRYSSTLCKDYTHSAMELMLEDFSSREIYGKNGHLWCKLVCGRRKGALVINLPGPYDEAKAAMRAFLRSCEKGKPDLQAINQAMAEAVMEQYPKVEAKAGSLA